MGYNLHTTIEKEIIMFGKFENIGDTQLTLREIYKSKGYDFESRVIVMACEGGQRIPFPKRYLDIPYSQAFEEIAEIVKRQGILIKDGENGKLPRNFVHHYEWFPPQTAVKFEKLLGLQDQPTLIKHSTAPTKLLVLDVEGTIITNYDYNNALPDGRFPAVIDPKIKERLENLQKAGFIIVLATGTDGDNLEYYKSQFEAADFLRQISSFSPEGHSSTDSKEDKLLKYAKQYNVTPSDIYYYDDGKGNIDRAISSGVKNSFQVTEQAPLVNQLNQLVEQVSPLKIGCTLTQYNKALSQSDSSYQIHFAAHTSNEQGFSFCCRTETTLDLISKLLPDLKLSKHCYKNANDETSFNTLYVADRENLPKLHLAISRVLILEEKKPDPLFIKSYAQYLSTCTSNDRNNELAKVPEDRVGLVKKEMTHIFKKTLYNHANMENNSRFHLFKANYAGESDLFKGLTGDALKTAILLYAKDQLTHDKDFLETFQTTKEYKILAASQGMTSTLFNLKTDSIKALERMIEEQNNSLDPSNKTP